MERRAPSELFPPNFPPQLAAAAFISGTETAWRPAAAIEAVEWFGAHGYAMLGTELWLLQAGRIQSLPIGLSGEREVHGNTVNREKNEAWDTFVIRCASETLKYLKAFKPADIAEEGDLHFQISWISKGDFDKLKAKAKLL
ncbi:MAG TPA: hypothetical protein VGX94_06510 [Terriglobia bacterium]|nr:hypothetical protein [Terriglobia bacterium]